MNEDQKWMKIAIQEAKKAVNEGEVPVGAILVKNGMVIAKAHNRPITKNDATAHAEILAIRKTLFWLSRPTVLVERPAVKDQFWVTMCSHQKSCFVVANIPDRPHI